VDKRQKRMAKLWCQVGPGLGKRTEKGGERDGKRETKEEGAECVQLGLRTQAG